MDYEGHSHESEAYYGQHSSCTIRIITLLKIKCGCSKLGSATENTPCQSGNCKSNRYSLSFSIFCNCLYLGSDKSCNAIKVQGDQIGTMNKANYLYLLWPQEKIVMSNCTQWHPDSWKLEASCKRVVFNLLLDPQSLWTSVCKHWKLFPLGLKSNEKSHFFRIPSIFCL